MRFEVHIGMDNAAFEDEGKENELARILRELADRVESSELEPQDVMRLLDVNGNRVGFAVVQDVFGEAIV